LATRPLTPEDFNIFPGLQMLKLEEVRDAVASELEARGIGDPPFYEQIREGRRDDGPFMIGALALAKRRRDDGHRSCGGST